MIDLNKIDMMTAKEAAQIWGFANLDYVRQLINRRPDKFPSGSIRKVGSTWLVTSSGMEEATGIKDPRKSEK